MMSSNLITYENQVSVSMATPCSSSIVEDQVKQIFGNVSNCSIGSITLNVGSDACEFLTDERDEEDVNMRIVFCIIMIITYLLISIQMNDIT